MGKAHLQTLHLTVKKKRKNNKEKSNKDKRKSVEKESKTDHNKTCKLKFKLTWRKKASN